MIYYPGRYLIEMRRIISIPYIQLMMRLQGLGWDRSWKIYGLPIIQRFPGSTISLGERIDLRSWPQSNPVVPFSRVLLGNQDSPG